MSDSIIGKVGVDVYPNTKNFRKKLQADLEAVERSLNDIKADLDLDADELIRETQAAVKAAERSAGDIKVKVDVDRSEALRQIDMVEKELAKVKFHPKFDEMAAKSVKRDMEDLLLKREDLRIRVGAELDPLAHRRLKRDLGDVEEALHDIEQKTASVNLNLRRQHSILSRSVARIGDMDRGWRNISKSIGEAAGEGSRNNFLNFTGKRVGALALAVGSVGLAVGGMVGAVSKGVDKFRELSDAGASTAKSLAGGLATGVMAATQSLVSLAVALASALLLFGSMAILVPIVTMLAGAVIALAGSIVIGLMAALLPLIPILAALALGLGAAAAAFVPLIDDIKEGKGAFAGAKREIDGLKSSVKALGKEAAPALGRLAETFSKGAKALVESFGPAVTRVFGDLDKKLRSPSMDKFYDQWTDKMPKIFENFGKGLSSLGVALTAFFAPVLGFAEDLSASFKKTMDRFSEWARSAEGQNSIADFLEKARDRGAKLWNIIKDIGTGFWNMMSVGDEKAGNDILSYLERVSAKFEEWSRRPKKLSDFVDVGIDAGTAKASGIPGIERNESSGLEKFMEDVRTFSVSMKTAGEEVGKFFRELNKPENREKANQVADALATIAGSLESIGTAMGKAIDFGSLINSINVGLMSITVSLMLFPLTIINGITTGLQAGLGTIPAAIFGVVSAIALSIINVIANVLGIHSPSLAMIGLMADVGAGILQGLLLIPGLIAGALLSIAMAIINAFVNIPAKVAEKLAPLAGAVGKAIDDAKTRAVERANSLVDGAISIIGGLPSKAGIAAHPLGSVLGGEVDSAKSSTDRSFRGLVASGVGIAGTLPGKVGSAVKSLTPTLNNEVVSAWGSATSSTRRGVTDVNAAANLLLGQLAATFAGVKASMSQVGADIVAGLAGGIRANAQAAANAAAAAAGAAVAAAKLALASRSPSKKFIQIGKDTMLGFKIGVDKNAKAAADAVRVAAQKATRAGAKATKKGVSLKGLADAGRGIAVGLTRGLWLTHSDVRSAIDALSDGIGKMSDGANKDWARASRTALSKQLTHWESLYDQYNDMLQVIRDLRKEKADFASGMVSDILGISGLGDVEGGFSEIIHRMTVAKDMATEFAKHLTTLRKNGLSKDLYEQIAALGPEAGLGAARALAEAGKAGVNQVNALQKDLLKTSSKLGDQSASYLYDSGIEMASAIASGFGAQMKTVEKEMVRVARNLITSINRQLTANGSGVSLHLTSPATTSSKYMLPINPGTQNVLNYYAAPGTTMSDQQQLFKAFKKVGFN